MTHKHSREWFDDNDFWQELDPFLFPEARFAVAPEQVEKILALTKPGGKAVLDLCCGPGRLSIALARIGFSVTGVDKTAYLLNQARIKAEQAKLPIEWIEMDMRDFRRPGAFDLALSMFTSFGYFDDKREDVRVLDNIYKSLKPGGSMLIDVVGKECVARILQPATLDVLADGTQLVQRHEVFDDWTRIRNEWILIKGESARHFHFHHTIYSGQELKDRMERVGFTAIKLYGNLDGDEYGINAQRLIAIGRKSV